MRKMSLKEQSTTIRNGLVFPRGIKETHKKQAPLQDKETGLMRKAASRGQLVDMGPWDQQGDGSRALFVPTLCGGRDPEFVCL